ncbi:MAG: hypothetical protein ACK5DE_01480, partial [Bacteroidota bacterium]
MKDPAFLFYSSDFLTGTMLLNMEQRGKYITLLCLQHNKGRLSEKDMLHICGAYDSDVFAKFTKDEEGYFFNERLSTEIQKRKAYSESRRNNRIKKDMTNISNTYVPHMENENENINENINKDEIVIEDANEKKVTRKKFVKPEEHDVYNLMGELNMQANNFLSEARVVSFAKVFMDHYESNGWVVGKTSMKDWQSTVRNWMRKEYDKVKNQKPNSYGKQSNSTADSIAKANALFAEAVAISNAR